MVAAVASFATVAGALVTGVVGSAPAAHAAPAAKVVNAWLPWWTAADATQTVVNNSDLFNEASPFWFQTTGTATVAIKTGATAAGLTSLVNTLHARGVKVVPTVTDAMPAATTAAIMSDPNALAQHVSALMGLISAYNLDGLDIDYENIAFASNLTLAPQIRTGYVALLTQLAAQLHARGKMLSVAVLAKTQEGTSAASQAYNYAAIGARSTGGGNSHSLSGTPYALRLGSDGTWQFRRTGTTIHSGALNGFDATAWHRLAIRVTGDQMTGFVDGSQVFTWTDSAPYLSGRVDLASGFGRLGTLVHGPRARFLRTRGVEGD